MKFVKNNNDIELMRKANHIVADVLALMQDLIKPGVSTKELDRVAYDYIIKSNARPSFLGYGGFPATICASINEEVVHGIPDKDKIVQEGDIISIDCGTVYRGFNGDAARTYAVGKISELKQKLIEITKNSFFKGIEILRDGVTTGTLGYSIQSYVEENGFSVVRSLVGHGIGKKMHEEPQVPNYGEAGTGFKLKEGMTIAIEPMVNAGVYEVNQLSDGWTIVTADGLPSAHYENTVAITENGVDILSIKE